MFSPIPYPGSFKLGLVFRTGDPVGGVWRHVERCGTVESLGRIAKKGKWPDPSKANVASLRFRQAVELGRAAREASLLTRPLTLYYSMLNLTRGVLACFKTTKGHFGQPSHGLGYDGKPHLLDCAATVTKSGAFADFARALVPTAPSLQGQTLSLRDLLAQIPEMHADFPLLNAGDAATARVTVTAFVRGEMLLKFDLTGITKTRFNRDWESLLPWMKDVCVLEGSKPFTLRVNSPPKDPLGIAAFCGKKLLHGLRSLDDSRWFDHVARPGVTLLPHRMLPYLAAMYILSNVVRYEPELLAGPSRELTDAGYALTTFLDAAERYYPQLALGILYGQLVYFE